MIKKHKKVFVSIILFIVISIVGVGNAFSFDATSYTPTTQSGNTTVITNVTDKLFRCYK